MSRSSLDGTTCSVFRGEDAACSALSAARTPGSFVSDQTLIHLAESLGTAPFVSDDGLIVFSRSSQNFMSWRPVGIRNGVRYFPASPAGSLIASGTTARLSGFGPSLISTPKAQYSLDIPSPSSFCQDATLGFVELDADQETVFAGAITYKHHIQAQSPAGEVAMLLTRKGKKYTADYAPVRKNGVLEIKSNGLSLNFIADFNQLGGSVSAGRTPPSSFA